jgi:HD-like signal output (HDOD) protein/CheY-like chemotaxis protein
VKRVLFVDDDATVLSGLQRMLRPMRAEWEEMAFAGGGEEALRLLAERPFDVVVSDMRMPGIDGVQLLGEVKLRYPGVVRIVLSGHADQEMILRSIGPAHQFLSKPCQPDLLRSTVDRACTLQQRLSSPELKQVAAQMGALPSLPSLYNEVLAEINSPKGSIETVGRIISRDVAMTAKVLQIVNSAFFGVRQRVTEPAHAARFLGMETIKALVLSVQVFSRFERAGVAAAALQQLSDASMRVGAFARLIAREEGLPREVADQSFFAGLLHDVGALLLLANRAEAYVNVRAAAAGGLEEAEAAAFGASHGDLGAYLLGIWGLPGPIVEAVAFHHRPGQLQPHALGALTCVHAADAIEAELFGDPRLSLPDPGYLAALGLDSRYGHWRDVCVAAGEEQPA